MNIRMKHSRYPAGTTRQKWLVSIVSVMMAGSALAACSHAGSTSTATTSGNLTFGSSHNIHLSNGHLAMPLPRLAQDTSVAIQSDGTTKVTFGLNYAVANDHPAKGIRADQAIIHVSVARMLLPTGPSTYNPEYSTTFVDAQLNKPSVTRSYSVSLPSAITNFLKTNGLTSSDATTKANAEKLIGVDVQQMRDFRHVDGNFDWQEGGFWTADDHPLTTSDSESSSVTVANNTNAGVYSVSLGDGQATSLVNATSSYGVPISLSGQAVECVDQGTGNGSDPAGFSLLNGWDIQDGLAPGVLPAGDSVSEEVTADDSIGASGTAAAQDMSEGAVDVALSALGQTTPGLQSAISTTAALLGVAGDVADFASGVPIGAILNLLKALINIQDSCADYANVFNLTAAEPFGGQASVSWADQTEGLMEQYQDLYGQADSSATQVTTNVGLSQSSGTVVGANGTSVHPYLTQNAIIACGASDSNTTNACKSGSTPDNYINVDWSATDPCPNNDDCNQTPATSPQLTIPGTSLCGVNNSLCPTNAQPVSGNIISYQTLAQSSQHVPAYAVIGSGTLPSGQQAQALATVNGIAYAGGHNGNLYVQIPNQTTANTSTKTTSTSSGWEQVSMGGVGHSGSITTMASSGSSIYVGWNSGDFGVFIISSNDPASGTLYGINSLPQSAIPIATTVAPNGAAGGQVDFTLWSNGNLTFVSGNSSFFQSSDMSVADGSDTNGSNWPGGAQLESITVTQETLFVGLSNGNIWGCTLTVSCTNDEQVSLANPWEFFGTPPAGINGSDAISAMASVGNTLYVGTTGGGIYQQSLVTSTTNFTTLSSGCTQGDCATVSHADATSNTPDFVAAMTAVDGNIYVAGCLGVADPISGDFLGVAVTIGDLGSPFSPLFVGCTEPPNFSNNFPSPSSIAMASTTAQTGIVYVTFYQDGTSRIYELENLLPFTNYSCTNGPCPTAPSS